MALLPQVWTGGTGADGNAVGLLMVLLLLSAGLIVVNAHLLGAIGLARLRNRGRRSSRERVDVDEGLWTQYGSTVDEGCSLPIVFGLFVLGWVLLFVAIELQM